MSLRDKIEHAIQNQPCMVKDLKAKFGGDRAADRKVMEALDELVHDAVVCQKSGVFFTARSGRAEKALPCKVVKLGKNFAFVMLEDESGDIFIPGRFTRGAMPGDKVLVEKFEHPRVEGSDEGEILAVLEEKNDLVGTVRRVEGMLKFVPDDCPAISMRMMRDCEGGAKDGDKVAVEILQQVEGFDKYDKMIEGLTNVFEAAENAANSARKSAKEFAEKYKDAPVVYVMSSGASMEVAYSTSICLMMEMQWVNSGSFHSGEFFHGPFEIVDKDVPFILLMNDGKTRPVDARALTFLHRFDALTTVVDAKDYGLGNAVDSSVITYFNPMMHTAVFRVYAEELSYVRQHPLTLRRYMWKLEY